MCDSTGAQVADFATDAEAVAHVAALNAQNIPTPQLRTIALDGGRSLRVHPDDAQALMDLANMPALQQQRALTDAAKAEAQAAEARATRAETDAATHKAAAEAAQAELTTLKTKEDERALKTLRADAKRLLGDDGVAVDSMDRAAIQKAVIGAVPAYKDISLDARTPEALDVFYESAVKLIEADRAHLGGGPRSGGSGDPADGSVTDARPSSGPDPKALRQQWMNRQQNFGQTPVRP